MPGRLLKRFFSRLRFLTLSSCHPLLAPPPSNASLFISLSLSLSLFLYAAAARVLLMIPINLELLGFPISQSEPAICGRLCLSAAFFYPTRPNMDRISGKRAILSAIPSLQIRSRVSRIVVFQRVDGSMTVAVTCRSRFLRTRGLPFPLRPDSSLSNFSRDLLSVRNWGSFIPKTDTFLLRKMYVLFESLRVSFNSPSVSPLEECLYFSKSHFVSSTRFTFISKLMNIYPPIFQE